jgi:hypothetical protein
MTDVCTQHKRPELTPTKYRLTNKMRQSYFSYTFRGLGSVLKLGEQGGGSRSGQCPPEAEAFLKTSLTIETAMSSASCCSFCLRFDNGNAKSHTGVIQCSMPLFSLSLLAPVYCITVNSEQSANANIQQS